MKDGKSYGRIRGEKTSQKASTGVVRREERTSSSRAFELRADRPLIHVVFELAIPIQGESKGKGPRPSWG